ncbi:Cupredoxin [Nemania sp. FL0031]|nr:Cupredoxin [Nemania sp. FL0031]
MKCLAALSLAMAPLAMAKAIQNVYPVEARDGHSKRTSHKLGGGNAIAVEASETQIVIIWVNPGNNAATTTINNAVTVTQTVTAGAVDATVGTTTIAAGATGTVAGTGATHTVQVGGSAGLAYSPPQVNAAVGDMVVFTFMSMNHTATQSTFDAPCDPMAGGMDSGFMANPNNTVVPAPQVAMQVMDTKPVWFYCRQTGHCGKGMVFSINPTAEKTQAIFQAMAIQQKGQGAGSAITGNGTAADGSAGSASSVASDVAATSTAAVATETAAGGATATGSADGSIQTGSGQLVAGACVCAVTCGAGSFPAVNAQGIGNFGGVGGSIPINMAEVF